MVFYSTNILYSSVWYCYSDIAFCGNTTKSLQSCPTLCDSIDGSPTGSPILGFSRQEHWSGLPFPSPMHESEVAQSYQWPHGLQPTSLLHPWDFPGKSTGVGCHLPEAKSIRLWRCLTLTQWKQSWHCLFCWRIYSFTEEILLRWFIFF